MSDSPIFRPTGVHSHVSSTATSGSSSSFLDDLLDSGSELGDLGMGMGTASIDDSSDMIDMDDGVIVNTATGIKPLSKSGSLSQFPDLSLSGAPSTSDTFNVTIISTDTVGNSQQSRDHAQSALKDIASTHLTQCIDHLLVANSISPVWASTVRKLSERAASTIKPDLRRGDLTDIRHYVKIQIIPGAGRRDCQLFDGLVFQHSVSQPSSVINYSMDKVRVLLFAGSFEAPPRSAADAQSSRFLSFMDQSNSAAEREFMDRKLPGIMFLRPDLILVERNVSKLALDALNKAGVSVIQNVKLSVLARVARSTGASIVQGVEGLDGKSVGQCGRFHIEEYGIVVDENDRGEQDEQEDFMTGHTAAAHTHAHSGNRGGGEPDFLSDLLGSNTSNATSNPITIGNDHASSSNTSPSNFTSILGSSFYKLNSPTSSSLLSAISNVGGGGSDQTPPRKGSLSSLFGVFSSGNTPPQSQSALSHTLNGSHANSTPAPLPTFMQFIYLEQCNPSAQCTIVLRGSRSTSLLHRLHRVLHQTIHIAYHLTLESSFLLDSFVTYAPSAIETLKQQALSNLEQARAALMGLDETAGPPQFMTLLSSSPFVTLPPIPFYQSLVNYKARFPLPHSKHLQPPPSQSLSSPSAQSQLQSNNLPPSQPQTKDIFFSQSSTPSHTSSTVTVSPSQLSFSSTPPPVCTAVLQSNLLLGSCWFTNSGQCRPPDLKQIDFYQSSDKTLHEFLFVNCFDSQAKCINPQCRKDMFRHSLAYTHNDGRLTITVKRLPSDIMELMRREEEQRMRVANSNSLNAGTFGGPTRSTSSPALTQLLANMNFGDNQLPLVTAARPSSPSPGPMLPQHSPTLGPSGGYSPTSQHRQLPLPPPPALYSNAQSPTPNSNNPNALSRFTQAFNPQPQQQSLAFSFQPTSSSPTPASPHSGHSSLPSPGPMSASASQPASIAPQSVPLIMWSRCRVCNARVTPYTPLAHFSLLLSFGKFLDLTFNNSVIRTRSSCPHSVHDSHQRFIAAGSMVACFEYEQAQPFAIVSRPRVKYDKGEVTESRLMALSTLAMLSKQVFEDFLSKINEIEKYSGSTPFKDLLLTLQSKVKQEHETFFAFFKKHGLRVHLLDQSATTATAAALVQSLTQDEDAASSALFGSTGPSSPPMNSLPPIDTFDINRLHRRFVTSFMEWNKMLTELCSLIFPRGLPSDSDGGLGGDYVEVSRESFVDRSQPQSQGGSGSASPPLHINTEKSALRSLPAPMIGGLSNTGASSLKPVIDSSPVPRTPLTPNGSFNREPLTPTFFSSLNAPPSSIASSVSPVVPKPDTTAAFKSLLSDMFTAPNQQQPKRKPRAFKAIISADDLIEHAPKLCKPVEDLIASPLNHGHLALPPCVGNVAVSVYDDEPSSMIAYTLASIEHMQCVNPGKLDEMKALEAASVQPLTSLPPNGHAVKHVAVSAEINFFDDPPMTSETRSQDSLFIIDNYASNAAPTANSNTGNTGNLFDTSFFNTPCTSAAQPATTAQSRLPSSQSSMARPISANDGLDAQRRNQRASVNQGSNVHPHTAWFSVDRPDWALEQMMTAGFTDKSNENDNVFKHKFDAVPATGSQFTSEQTQFRVTVYFPRQFHALRSFATYGDYDFIQSLSRSDKWASTGGKSGSTFAKTSDDRFVLKFVKRTELNMFIDFAAAYFHHMAKVCFHHLPSVLIKTLGVYSLTWQRGKEKSSSLDVIVMPNLFFQREKLKVFDLKGSERNRYIKQTTTTTTTNTTVNAVTGTTDTVSTTQTQTVVEAQDGATLLDLNLWEYTRGLPIPINDHSHSLLRMALHNDSYFLANLEVIDYSLLVGFDHHHHELLVGVIDYIRQYTWDKKLETGMKSMGRIAGQAVPTVINPQNYKQRFRAAMEKYFMLAPDQCAWYRRVQELEEQQKEQQQSGSQSTQQPSAGQSYSHGHSQSQSSPTNDSYNHGHQHQQQAHGPAPSHPSLPPAASISGKSKAAMSGLIASLSSSASPGSSGNKLTSKFKW